MNASGRPFAPGLGRAGLRAVVLALVACIAPVRGASSAADPAAAEAGAPKVLRYAMRIAETGFDPAQISDLYSNTLAAHMFDALYEYEFLARPVRIRPRTAAGMPEASDDFKTFVVRVRPGIYFVDDPAFKGKRRELVAQDYVYSIKRHFDPRWKSPRTADLENIKLLGMAELREAAIKGGKPFDYDREVEGLRALDRYTLQFKLGQPNPRFAGELTTSSVTGAVAREVVEFYSDRIMEHPVGTGPFRLAEWRRSAQIVFEKNPSYRDEYYDEEAPADDPMAQAAVARLKGRKLPMVDRVEVSVIEENQPRWLSFVNAEMDVIEQVPEDFTYSAIPNNKRRAQPRQARHLRGPLPAQRCLDVVFRDGASVDRRLRARARSRCAGRSRWRSTSTRRSASCGAARRSRRSRSWGPASAATTRRSRAR